MLKKSFFLGESDQIEITKPILAGSSTYDLVLKKTNDADPSEVIYGTTVIHILITNVAIV